MLSHHILMNILSMNFYNYLVTKRSLNNTPYRKFSLTANNIPKQERNLIYEKKLVLNVFLISFLPYLYTARIWLNLITWKAFRSSRLQMFYKIGVLKNCAKLTGKQLCWRASLFNKVSHVLSYDLCGIFKNTYFLITLQNQTTLLRKQISKVI